MCFFSQRGLPENGTIEGLQNEILHFDHTHAEIRRKFYIKMMILKIDKLQDCIRLTCHRF